MRQSIANPAGQSDWRRHAAINAAPNIPDVPGGRASLGGARAWRQASDQEDAGGMRDT